jgi:hypothetical protein
MTLWRALGAVLLTCHSKNERRGLPPDSCSECCLCTSPGSVSDCPTTCENAVCNSRSDLTTLKVKTRVNFQKEIYDESFSLNAGNACANAFEWVI